MVWSAMVSYINMRILHSGSKAQFVGALQKPALHVGSFCLCGLNRRGLKMGCRELCQIALAGILDTNPGSCRDLFSNHAGHAKSAAKAWWNRGKGAEASKITRYPGRRLSRA